MMTAANGDRELHYIRLLLRLLTLIIIGASQCFDFFQKTRMSGRRFGVLPGHVAVSPTLSGSVVIRDVNSKYLGALTNITLLILPYRRILGWHTVCLPL